MGGDVALKTLYSTDIEPKSLSPSVMKRMAVSQIGFKSDNKTQQKLSCFTLPPACEGKKRW